MCKVVCVFFGCEVEAVDLPVVPPLVKRRCGLVIFETFKDCTVYHDLQMIQRKKEHLINLD